MTHASTDPLLGHTLEGRYTIRSRIARGGMAVVYEGIDERLHRRVAIKVMHHHLAEDEEFKKRFEQEARNAAKLTHPNLVSVLDQGEDAGVVFLVMEHIPGITLRDLLKKQGFLTHSQAVEIGEAMLEGLAAAHQAGIIHRDLKPENVLLADDGRIKLGDFGLARAAGTNTSTGQALLGTIAYLPPELLTRGVADKQSDVYSFGIMLYEMLTGEQPFTGEQPMQVAYQHANDEIPLPSALSSESTPVLDEIVRWCAQKDPVDRPADATELLRALKNRSPIHAQPTAVLQTASLPALNAETTRFARESETVNPVPVKKPPKAETGATNHPAISKAVQNEKRRRVSRIILILFFVLISVGAFAGSWWKFQGPGSDVLIPDLVNQSTESAIKKLHDLSLLSEVTQCNDVDIEPGLIVSTNPGAGERAKRESTVVLCESIGPAQLPVPNLEGLSIAEATEAIEAAGFTFGGVSSEMFSEQQTGLVLYAQTPSGENLPDLYPEKSERQSSVSARALPDVAGMSVDEAKELLMANDLKLDDDENIFDYSDEFSTNTVIGLIVLGDPVYRGDLVALNISLGPELFAVPDVTGLTVREAMQSLSDHGFVPKAPWYLNEAALDAFDARGTSPAAGELLPLGVEVEVSPKIF
ncbi:MAG TPA: Stk1 family PASTA domain-containing Ser/Thr kinase [Microbacteriaceae bacterium]|nr:Stk1 family PASTA domain-containing Ser/Thr kinase [Microbacteriaceae bacterium]